jgi:hypothetical protein
MAYLDDGGTKLIAYQEYANSETQEYPENILILSFDYQHSEGLQVDSIIKSKEFIDPSTCLYGKSTPIQLRIYDQEPGNPELRFSGIFTGKEQSCYPYPAEKYSSLNSLIFDHEKFVIKELDSY